MYESIELLLNELYQADLVIRTDTGWKVNPAAKMLYKALGFQDVAIAQNKNVLASRLDADISSEVFRGVKLKVPALAANMSTVVNSAFCNKLSELGALGVMHRAFKHENDYIKEVMKLDQTHPWRAASIGVDKGQFNLAKRLVHAGINILFIDIAHGYSDAVIELAAHLKDTYNDTVKVVVGNTINTESLYDFNDIADAIKVGIGNGAACLTKNTAGCTEPQFSAVLKFKEEAKRLGMPIISDGGIKEPADFVKAIGAGASSVMMGKVFAVCSESAAPEATEFGKRVYAGMASSYTQNLWRGGVKSGTCAEGEIVLIDGVGPTAADTIELYVGALKSGITYSGAVDVASFQKLVKFIRI